jgi:hypothetical protein
LNNEAKAKLVEIIILQLGDNYINTDKNVINNFVDYYLEIASNASNRELSDIKLVPYVNTAVVMAYLRRGKEASSSNSEGGLSDSFLDIEEKLKKDIKSIRKLA